MRVTRIFFASEFGNYFQKLCSRFTVLFTPGMAEMPKPSTIDKSESDEECLASSESQAKRLKVDDNRDSDGSNDGGDKQGPCQSEDGAPARIHKRKCALLMSFCGKDYKGMQLNPGVKTIEEDLIQCLFKAGAINEEMRDNLGKLKFQRCARTDKGVSAVRQLVSLKMVPDPAMVSEVNSHLPAQIRVMKLFRVIRSFSSKDWCSSRTYEYFIPTYAFCSDFKSLSRQYRVTPDVLAAVDSLLGMYCGTHNFHNFTSGRKPGDPSCKRYIMSFRCSQPRLIGDTEYVSIMVQGQSFMLHQIRKMIGLVLAVVRGFATKDIMERIFQKEKVDIPRAPGLYLILDNVHFDRYNKKFGEDGLHESLDWLSCEEDIARFKAEHIYSVIHEAELTCSPMTEWLATLNIHLFFESQSLPRLPPAPTPTQQDADSKADHGNEEQQTDNKLTETLPA